MPKLGGFDVLAVMQKERWLDDIPVMMISAEDSPAFIQKAYDMGASDYITRPFNMNVVRQRSDNITKLYAKQRRLLSLVSSQIQEKNETTTSSSASFRSSSVSKRGKPQRTSSCVSAASLSFFYRVSCSGPAATISPGRMKPHHECRRSP